MDLQYGTCFISSIWSLEFEVAPRCLVKFVQYCPNANDVVSSLIDINRPTYRMLNCKDVHPEKQ
jgi:hypothetical protein